MRSFLMSSTARRSRPRDVGRAIATACQSRGAAVESIGAASSPRVLTCHAAANLVPAIVEQMEPRTHLTATFTANVAGAAGGVHTRSFGIKLWTTGGIASKWVINWGDLTMDTYYASAQPGGVFPVPFAPTPHSYAIGTYAITATATSTGSSSATTTYALKSSFGTVTGQGQTVAVPSGDTGSATGHAMAIDASNGKYAGYIYVASSYGSESAVTRFKPDGTVDTTFGNSTTPGTWVLTGMGNGTATSIAVSSDGDYVAVAGSFSGWGEALIETDVSAAGTVLWAYSGHVSNGQANAVTIDASDGEEVIAAGWVPGACGSGCCMAVQVIDADGSCCTGFNSSSCGFKAFSTGSSTCDTATSVVDGDEVGYDDFLLIGGYSNYGTGSDFTLVEMNDSGTLATSFGGTGVVRTNIGNRMGSANGAVNYPSTDVATSLTYTSDAWLLVGHTNAVSSADHVAMAEYDEYGNLVNGFGPYSSGHDGVSVGPAGDAYSVAATSAGTILLGGSSGNDFLACQFTSAGVLDTADFGTGGIFTTDFGDTTNNSTDVALGIAIETDGSILLGGATTPSGGSGKIALSDYLPSPSITIS